MEPALALLRSSTQLDDAVAELAVLVALASGAHRDVATWLARQDDVADIVVEAALAHPSAVDMCLFEPKLLPMLAWLEPALAASVVRGVLDQCRSGGAVRWRGHAALVELAAVIGDSDILDVVSRPWFARSALMGADEVGSVISAFQKADPTGAWMVELLDDGNWLPVETLAKLATAVEADSPGADALPWEVPGGEEWAVDEYSQRLFQLASACVERKQWPVLAKLAATWDGTLGDLVRCVREVSA